MVLHSSTDYQNKEDIGILNERTFPCPNDLDWHYHKHNNMKIIGKNNYLLTSGTYGVLLFKIDESEGSG